MGKLTNSITKHKKLIISFFVIATVVCAFLSTLVHVNYDLKDYLPKDAK